MKKLLLLFTFTFNTSISIQAGLVTLPPEEILTQRLSEAGLPPSLSKNLVNELANKSIESLGVVIALDRTLEIFCSSLVGKTKTAWLMNRKPILQLLLQDYPEELEAISKEINKF